jgi:hypothetical protein
MDRLLARHVGQSRCVDVTRNDDGTFTYTLIAELGDACTQIRFTAAPFFEFDLKVFEGDMQHNASGQVIVRDIPSFHLGISGRIKSDENNFYLTQQHVPSPYGDGKDQCGRDLPPEGQQ